MYWHGPFFFIADTPVSDFVWNFKTQGMTAVGQDELAILLVKKPEEQIPPRDIFEHLQSLYEQAGRGSHIAGQWRILNEIWYAFRLYIV